MTSKVIAPQLLIREISGNHYRRIIHIVNPWRQKNYFLTVRLYYTANISATTEFTVPPPRPRHSRRRSNSDGHSSRKPGIAKVAERPLLHLPHQKTGTVTYLGPAAPEGCSS